MSLMSAHRHSSTIPCATAANELNYFHFIAILQCLGIPMRSFDDFQIVLHGEPLSRQIERIYEVHNTFPLGDFFRFTIQDDSYHRRFTSVAAPGTSLHHFQWMLKPG